MKLFTLVVLSLFASTLSSVFASESIFGLVQSAKTLSLNSSSFVSDKANFLINYSTKLEVFDINTIERINTFTIKDYPALIDATKFAYVNEADTTIYFSSGDTSRITLIKCKLVNPTQYDTLELGGISKNILFYLSYDRKTLYTYQNNFQFQSIDLATMKFNFQKPFLEDFKVYDFAVDENYKILHLAGFVNYYAVNLENYDEIKTIDQYSATGGNVCVSPDGKTALYITNENEGYGNGTAILVDVQKKSELRRLPVVNQTLEGKFIDNDLILFNNSSTGLRVYSVSEDKFLHDSPYVTIARPLNYKGENGILSWNSPNQLSIRDVRTNKIIKNYFDTFTPMAILGDTLIVSNSGITEYWNVKTNKKLVDTVIALGRINNKYRKSVTFPENKMVYRNLNTLEVEKTVTLPFESKYVSIIGMTEKFDRLFAQLNLSKDSIVEYDVANNRIIDTSAMKIQFYSGHGTVANSLKYYHNFGDYSKIIYKCKSNDTLIDLTNARKFIFSQDGEYGAVIDTNLSVYRLQLNSLEHTTPIVLPIDNTYSWMVSSNTTLLLSNDNKFAFVASQAKIDTTGRFTIWIVDLDNAEIIKTIVMDQITYPSLNQVSDDNKSLVVSSRLSTYMYSTGLGINSVDDINTRRENSMQVYPQPASNSVTFSSNTGAIKTIKIYDNAGKIIFTSNAIGASILEFNTQSLTSGAYHYFIETESANESGNFIVR